MVAEGKTKVFELAIFRITSTITIKDLI